MLDYINYRKSISSELMSIKDRVRNFVQQWPEDGRYKEIILKNVLEKHLPKTVSIGTGFIIGDNLKTSSQIDIIVYSNAIPPFFQLGDFVIIPKEGVLGIIEVKTRIRNGELSEIIKKSHNNGSIIGKNKVFNGIFGFESQINHKQAQLTSSIQTALKNNHGYVNNICFGKDVFMKFWEQLQPNKDCRNNHYSFYQLRNLSFGYFVSNLVEDCYIQLNNECIPQTLKKYLYPIEGTKEERRIEQFEIELN